MSSFKKTLSGTDVKKQVAVESSFMQYLPYSGEGGTVNIQVRDQISGKMYEFAYYTRSRGHKKPVFQGQWRDYCRDKGLQADDRITFSANGGSYTILAERNVMKLFGQEVWKSLE